MTWLILAAAAVFVVVVLIRLLMARTGRSVQTTHLQLGVPELAPALVGARMVLLSDLHVGRLHVPAEPLLAAVASARPDVLLLGGDYGAGSATHADALELVRRLSEIAPTYGVMGNTDHNHGFDHASFRCILRASGGDLLINEAGHADVGGATVEVLGVDDPLHGHADVDATLAHATDGADLRIAMCHSPAVWAELERLGAQITLLGHTHGGQVRLPGLEAQVTHLTYPRELAAGLFRYAAEGEPPRRLVGHWELIRRRRPVRVSATGGPLIYVTRGVGMGVFPVRVLCPPELVIVEFERQDADGGAGADD